MRKPIRLDLRGARIPGGRLTVSLGTTSKVEARRRESALRRLVESGEWDVLNRLRRREVPLPDVVRAVEKGDVAALRPAVGGGLYALGRQTDRLLDHVTPGAMGNYAAILGLFRSEMGDGYAMESLTRADAMRWLRTPKSSNGDKPWGPARRELARTILGRLWAETIYLAREDAERTGDRSVLSRNPWRDAGPTRGTQEEIKPRVAYFTEAQWDRLLAEVRGTERAAFYALCCLAGLRRTEALMLRTDIDVELPKEGRGRIRVQPRDGGYPWKPKTRRSVRDVPVCADLREILEEHVRKGFAGQTYFIHPPHADRPFSEDTASGYWAPRDFKAAGLPFGRAGALTTHSLRHTFASWLVQRKADLLTVAKLMGDTVAMVEKVYAHLRPADLETTVDLLDRNAK